MELITAPGKKAKASVTISAGLLKAADAVAGPAGRSALIERAVRRYLRFLVQRERSERERALLDGHAGRLNTDSAQASADQADVQDS